MQRIFSNCLVFQRPERKSEILLDVFQSEDLNADQKFPATVIDDSAEIIF